MLSEITIVATTWLPPGKEEERADAFRVAMKSWERNLRYDAPIHLHVADDGTKGDYNDLLIKVATRWTRGEVSFSQQFRKGVGASLNTGIEIASRRSQLILHAVDDWQVFPTLNLAPWSEFLEDDNYSVGMVRFFPHPDLTGIVRHIPPHGWAVHLDPHHYVFGLRPSLFHKRFFEAYGEFQEGVSAIDAEADYNQRVVKSVGPSIWLALPEQWRPIETGSLSEVVPA